LNFREETNDISAIEKIPFKRTSPMIIRISIELVNIPQIYFF